MDLMTLAVLVIAAAVVVLVVVLVPAVQQLRKTLAATEESMKSIHTLVEEEVRPAVKSVNELVVEVDAVVRTAREGVEKAEDTIAAFQEVGETVRSLNSLLDTKLKGAIYNIVAYSAGIKVGVETLYKAFRYFKQKEAEE